MIAPQAESSEYDARIRRADKLIAASSSASGLLAFYKKIAAFQKGLLNEVLGAKRGAVHAPKFGSVREELDLSILLPHFRGFLSLVEQNAPRELAEAAKAAAALPREDWAAQLSEYWQNGGRYDPQIGAFEQFLPRAFLQPYAAYIARHIAVPPATETMRACPLCDARPFLGVLRVEGDGGKRWMVCSFCGHEWEFRRILCATCGEEDEKKLPVYVAEQVPHVRVEACETCRFFVRTIDLTKDGNAVPVVDDLAAIPLTLWAHEQGYLRIEPNLLGS
jgi:formate dehydrogenase accessory protein FdhE